MIITNNGTITVFHRYSGNKEKKKTVLSLKKKEKRQKSNKR